MTDPVHNPDLQALWQSQPVGDGVVSLDEIRTRARRLERIVARRNLREYVAAVIVLAGYGWMIWLVPSAGVRIGAGLIIAATVFVVWQLYVRGGATPLSADLALKSALEFHRQQLERQRDLVRSVWAWALLPFVPGMFVLMVAHARARPERLSATVAYGVVFVLLMAGLHGLNRHVAAKIQQRIDRLTNHR